MLGRAPPAPARHDLLLVAAGDWAAVAGTRPPLPPLSRPAEALVRRWGEAGWPVIVRRPAPGDPPGAVPVGLALLPALGKARVPLAIPPGLARRPAPRVGLADAAAAAPARWRPTIAGLLGLAGSLGLAPRVFGALMWQAATGMAYVGAGSDLDLLWEVGDGAALGPLLDGLERVAASAPMALDGEVLTAAGGVHWRELAAARRGGGGIVLAKRLDRAGFVRAAEILGGGGGA